MQNTFTQHVFFFRFEIEYFNGKTFFYDFFVNFRELVIDT